MGYRTKGGSIKKMGGPIIMLSKMPQAYSETLQLQNLSEKQNVLQFAN